MRKSTADISASLAVLAITAVFCTQICELDGITLYFPRLLLIFMGGGGLILLVKGIVGHMRNKPTSGEGEPVSIKRIGLITVCSLAYVLVIPILGFYPTTGLFLFGTALLLRDASDTRTALKAAAMLTVILGVSVWAGFSLLLGVPTPEGLLL